jgi:hypothetical protein
VVNNKVVATMALQEVNNTAVLKADMVDLKADMVDLREDTVDLKEGTVDPLKGIPRCNSP